MLFHQEVLVIILSPAADRHLSPAWRALFGLRSQLPKSEQIIDCAVLIARWTKFPEYESSDLGERDDHLPRKSMQLMCANAIGRIRVQETLQ